jgi:hypothetical protein
MTLNVHIRTAFLAKVISGSFVVIAILLTACGAELAPLKGRAELPQPTFVAIEVTPAPESPTATPWPFSGENGVRAIPDGLDPELFAPASPEEVVDLWTEFLTGSTMRASSERLYFRGRGRFSGELHMCPGGMGCLDGEPSGTANWSVSPSVGSWYEVALTHKVPGRTEAVSFVLSIKDGLPVRSGSPDAESFTESDYCSNSDPGVERPAFTADERRLDKRAELVSGEIEVIGWGDAERKLPEALRVGSPVDITPETGAEYWNAYLSGGVLDAVAYDYGTFVLTKAFSGSLHMCAGRVAVLDGEPSGIGEWAVQPTGSNPWDAKIVFTLPGDRKFRILVLGVTADGPVLRGRNAETGLIGATPLELRESDECGQ